jgi:hypothetical protein
MKRRAFLALLAAAPVAAVSMPEPAFTTGGLMFHKDAFSMLWDSEPILPLSRMDVLYGFKTIQPEYAIRVLSSSEE